MAMVAGTALFSILSSAALPPNILFFMADGAWQKPTLPTHHTHQLPCRRTNSHLPTPPRRRQDTGWNNVQWHDTGEGAGMITPHSHALLKEGIELDKHYVFPVCSPSRSSFMSGRLPFHVQQINLQNCDKSQGVNASMTFISQKLKEAAYETVHVGKWHLGMATASLTPKGRGFDKSLVYFEGAQDHFTQRSCADPGCMAPINATTYSPIDPGKPSPYDLWVDNGTAAGAGSMGVGVPAAHLEGNGIQRLPLQRLRRGGGQRPRPVKAALHVSRARLSALAAAGAAALHRLIPRELVHRSPPLRSGMLRVG